MDKWSLCQSDKILSHLVNIAVNIPTKYLKDTFYKFLKVLKDTCKSNEFLILACGLMNLLQRIKKITSNSTKSTSKSNTESFKPKCPAVEEIIQIKAKNREVELRETKGDVIEIDLATNKRIKKETNVIVDIDKKIVHVKPPPVEHKIKKEGYCTLESLNVPTQLTISGIYNPPLLNMDILKEIKYTEKPQIK